MKIIDFHIFFRTETKSHLTEKDMSSYESIIIDFDFKFKIYSDYDVLILNNCIRIILINESIISWIDCARLR